MTCSHTARPGAGSSPDSWKLTRLFAARNSVVVSPASRAESIAICRCSSHRRADRRTASAVPYRYSARGTSTPRRARQFQRGGGLVDAALDVGVDEDRDAAVLDAQPDLDLAAGSVDQLEPGFERGAQPFGVAGRPRAAGAQQAGPRLRGAVVRADQVQGAHHAVPVVGLFERVRGAQPQLVGLRPGRALRRDGQVAGLLAGRVVRLGRAQRGRERARPARRPGRSAAPPRRRRRRRGRCGRAAPASRPRPAGRSAPRRAARAAPATPVGTGTTRSASSRLLTPGSPSPSIDDGTAGEREHRERIAPGGVEPAQPGRDRQAQAGVGSPVALSSRSSSGLPPERATTFSTAASRRSGRRLRDQVDGDRGVERGEPEPRRARLRAAGRAPRRRRDGRARTPASSPTRPASWVGDLEGGASAQCRSSSSSTPSPTSASTSSGHRDGVALAHRPARARCSGR